MSTDKLGQKYSLMTILEKYDRIEIPIIQRDYAQGREGKKETAIRNGILNHIFSALKPGGTPVELDFVYGVEPGNDSTDVATKKLFVPIDGQQRLTTLWLIHWYLAGKAGLLHDEASGVGKKLRKFTYETRVSSNDFMNRLCESEIVFSDRIKDYIIDEAIWFDESWKLDPSVMGFLTMLDAIANHRVVKENDARELYERLTGDEPSVSFYFLPLEKFGLGEEIYTRMNARGKVLTDFEKFKSNFFKIIDDMPRKDEITQKLEYDWVTNLWPYREKEKFVTDKPFMNWLRYITMMLSVNKDVESDESDDRDYLDMEYLERIYNNPDNLDFLIHSFDAIPKLTTDVVTCSLEWDGNRGLTPAVKWIMDTDKYTTDVIKQLCVFGALIFMREIPDGKGLDDYIRVLRNLIENTPDRSMREWPVMIESMKKLISSDVYATLCKPELQLPGFRSEQREIEIFKARMINSIDEARQLIALMDENHVLKAREGNMIIEMSEPVPTDDFTLSLVDINPEEVDCEMLRSYYEAYTGLQSYNTTDDFNGMWGELLQTRLYVNNDEVCWWTNGDDNYVNYANHPVMMKLVRQVVEHGGNVESMIKSRQQKIIKKFVGETDGDLAELSQPKDQLYLLYVATIRILNDSWRQFFVCNRFNFGWVEGQAGYSTPFNTLLGQTVNKIYQAYPQQFRSSSGVVDYRTPRILFAYERGKNFFKKLIDWAES